MSWLTENICLDLHHVQSCKIEFNLFSNQFCDLHPNFFSHICFLNPPSLLLCHPFILLWPSTDKSGTRIPKRESLSVRLSPWCQYIVPPVLDADGLIPPLSAASDGQVSGHASPGHMVTHIMQVVEHIFGPRYRNLKKNLSQNHLTDCAQI